MENSEYKPRLLDRPVHPSLPAFTYEVVLFILILLAAVATRFYDLGTRVMSHDESLHTYFSWLLYKGSGYQHSPMMHGPLQFHLLALSYYLFGVSDFTARIPSVLFSIATIYMVWYWRRYLGRAGALIAGILLVISPYMLYYGRYVRNESFVGLSGIVMLYVILRYLETGLPKYLYLLSASLVLHFLVKETSYIYAAQALLYLAVYFIARVTRQPWPGRVNAYRGFVIVLALGILFSGAALGMAFTKDDPAALTATETVAPANPTEENSPLAAPTAGLPPLLSIAVTLAILSFGAAGFLLTQGYGWENIRKERSFDLLILTGTLVLPLLAAFFLNFLKRWTGTAIPTDAASVAALTGRDIAIIGSATAVVFGLAVAVGLFWNREVWWKAAALFWSAFTVFYTTIFTNSAGFFTGLIGSLGYWLVQQDVERGSQPWYFYLLIQIPIYEFLPALGLILALIVGLRYRGQLRRVIAAEREAQSENALEAAEAAGDASTPEPLERSEMNETETKEYNFNNTFSLLVWWSISSVAAFSYAGEKMPWLTYHLTLPMILITGWALGHLIESLESDGLKERRPWLILTLLFIFVTSLTAAMGALFGANPPFGGKDLASLQATSDFLLPAIAAIASGAGLFFLLNTWSARQFLRLLTVTCFALLAVITARASFRASYVNYDDATEYLVYAHAATGVKDVIAQAKEISERTTGGMGVALAYDASSPDTGVSWPFVWYLRDFTNQRSFDAPTRSLRDAAVVVVDQKNFDKIEAALGPGYYRFDYIRMWWPNQDYFSLTYQRDPAQPLPETYSCRGLLSGFRLFKSVDFSRICNAILDPNLRAGIWDIWWNRDYTRYAAATNSSSMTLTTWTPADQMRLYLRKDIAAQTWNYGVGPRETIAELDPYAGNIIVLPADQIVDASTLGTTPLSAPRGLAFAPDGTFYAADSRNHRILRLAANGSLIGQWGAYGDGVGAPNPAGTFNEPWGVAVGPDGSVYVSDTWNHRIQKFSADGKPLKMWGRFGQGESPDAFWGPRGIAVDSQGRVYVADTGNKRIVIFDADGNFIGQFGSPGFDPGQFDEPVGIAVAPDGTVYVADTWNQRVQAFTASADGTIWLPARQWDINGWAGQSVDNKPFIAVAPNGRIFVADPEGYRILEFDSEGNFIRAWGDYGIGPAEIGLAAAVAVDAQGHVWVTDAANNRILRYTLP